MSDVVIAGASGFMGTHLADAMRRDGRRVRTIGRGPSADASWGDPESITRAVDHAGVVINLAGKPVHARYDDATRAEILRSRVGTTRELGEAIAAAATPPPVWLNASTATAYAHSTARTRRQIRPASGASPRTSHGRGSASSTPQQRRAPAGWRCAPRSHWATTGRRRGCSSVSRGSGSADRSSTGGGSGTSAIAASRQLVALLRPRHPAQDGRRAEGSASRGSTSMTQSLPCGTSRPRRSSWGP